MQIRAVFFFLSPGVVRVVGLLLFFSFFPPLLSLFFYVDASPWTCVSSRFWIIVWRRAPVPLFVPVYLVVVTWSDSPFSCIFATEQTSSVIYSLKRSSRSTQINNFFSSFFCIQSLIYLYIPSKPLIPDLVETLNLFFCRAWYHQNASYRKMNGIKVVDKLSICKVGSVHFWHLFHPEKLRILQEMVQSFHEVRS
jgi:hypothetical protein